MFKNLRFLLYAALRHDGYTDAQIRSVNSVYSEEFNDAFIKRYGYVELGDKIPTMDIIKALVSDQES